MPFLTLFNAIHSSSKHFLKSSETYRPAPLKPNIGFSSKGSKNLPPIRFAYSFDLKSDILTITGFGEKAAVIVEMPSDNLSIKKLTGSS